MHSAPTPCLSSAMSAVAVPLSERREAPPRTLLRTREARVCWLILAIAVFSVGDLVMTLDHLTTIGMGEANPIARMVMSTNSPAALIVWKLTSVGVACLAFYAGRKKLVGEVAAWFCCFVLIWLMLRWGMYSAELATICPQVHMLHHVERGQWVTMAP